MKSKERESFVVVLNQNYYHLFIFTIYLFLSQLLKLSWSNPIIPLAEEQEMEFFPHLLSCDMEAAH